MSRRIVNVGFVFGALFLFAFVASRLVTPGGPRPPETARVGPTVPAPTPVASPPAVDRATRSYAVKLVELQGLAPDAAPGTVFDLWVAWEPPLTRQPQFELLVPKVTLEKIVPATTPEGPATAVLRVRTADLRNVLYADRYGGMSVAVVPSTALARPSS